MDNTKRIEMIIDKIELKGPVDFYRLVSRLEDRLVDLAIAHTEGNKYQGSKMLGLNRTTLIEKLRKRGLITLRNPKDDEFK
jgi:DNA-binding protein Fis